MTRATADHHLYEELATWLQSAIESGALRPDTRVPSVRRMSQQRRVSVATVVQAYRTLEDRGLLEARPQSGYYVRPRPGVIAPMPRTAAPTDRPTRVGITSLAARLMREASDPRLVAFGAGCPSPGIYPHERLGRLLAAAAREHSTTLTRYQVAHTVPEFAAQIARRALLDGYRVDPTEIIATNGCIEALTIALRAVARPGEVVVVESPTYFNILEIVESLGLKAIEVPAHPLEGISLEALRVALENHPVRACVLIPNGHNPLGCTLSDEKKRALVTLAADYGVPIIEDDIYGEIHFGESRPRPLKAFDATGDVILVSSMSKMLAPGLRVGWIAGGRRHEQLRDLRAIASITTPVVSQVAVARFVASGGFDHHLRAIRRAYHGQLQLYARAVTEHFPSGVRLSRPAGGFFLWVELAPGFDSLRYHEEALQAGISIAPGAIFSPRRRFRNCVRLNTSTPWSPRIEEAIATLGRLAATQTRGAA